MNTLTLQDRINLYHEALPRAPRGSISVIPTPDGLGKISGVWEIGRLFQGSNFVPEKSTTPRSPLPKT